MRNEDCKNAPFGNESLVGVLSFDVLEHFTQVETAINEAFRVIRVVPHPLFIARK